MSFSKRSMVSVGSSSPGMSSFGELDDSPESGEKGTKKRKSRNQSEKRRRDQFNMLINELCGMVTTNNRKMDKTTVLKGTIAFLRQHNELLLKCQAHEINDNWKPSFLSNDEFAQLTLEGLDAFLLVITQRGTIMYTSESVTSLLNHLPPDIVGQPLYDLIHPDDRKRISALISNHTMATAPDKQDYELEENQLTFNCHVKCGSTLHGEPPVYEQVECVGNFWHWKPTSAYDGEEGRTYVKDADEPEVCFCCTVRLKTFQLVRELTMADDSKREFTSRHSMDWKFLFLDHRGPPIIGYLPFEVLGTSGYDYFHPEDLELVAKCHEQLMQTGKGTSCYYRFLTKGQQWIWLQTTFYITYHQWNSKPEFICCTNSVANYADIHMELKQAQLNPQKAALTLSECDYNPSGQDRNDSPSSMSVWLPSQLPAPPPARPLSPQSRSSTFQTSETESDVADSSAEQTVSKLALQVSLAVQNATQSLVNVPSQMPKANAGGPGGAQTSGRPHISPLLLPQPTPEIQRKLQEQLCMKHCQLQEAIMRQQEELNRISEQLLIVSQMAAPSSDSQDGDSESVQFPEVASTSKPSITQPEAPPSVETTTEPIHTSMAPPLVTVPIYLQHPGMLLDHMAPAGVVTPGPGLPWASQLSPGAYHMSSGSGHAMPSHHQPGTSHGSKSGAVRSGSRYPTPHPLASSSHRMQQSPGSRAVAHMTDGLAHGSRTQVLLSPSPGTQNSHSGVTSSSTHSPLLLSPGAGLQVQTEGHLSSPHLSPNPMQQQQQPAFIHLPTMDVQSPQQAMFRPLTPEVPTQSQQADFHMTQQAAMLYMEQQSSPQSQRHVVHHVQVAGSSSVETSAVVVSQSSNNPPHQDSHSPHVVQGIHSNPSGSMMQLTHAVRGQSNAQEIIFVQGPFGLQGAQEVTQGPQSSSVTANSQGVQLTNSMQTALNMQSPQK